MPIEGTWYHVISTTYGAWLYGDVRGFRTRHHREHVDGDYKSPPPIERYAAIRKRSIESLKQKPVVIPSSMRPVVGGAVCDRLQDQGAFVLCLSVSGQHLHGLVKVPPGLDPRTAMGQAKKHATWRAKAAGWEGKVWAKRGKELRVRDRKHQVNVFRYIVAHEEEGAWVWVHPEVGARRK